MDESKKIVESKIEREDVRKLHSLLTKYNLKETFEALKHEGKLNDALLEDIKKESVGIVGILADQYARLYEFIEGSMKIHRDELKLLLYPLFVHIYLHLMSLGHNEQASYFYELFEKCQEATYREDMLTIADMSKNGVDPTNAVVEVFTSNEFTVRVCKSSYNYLKKSFIEERMMTEIGVFMEEKIRVDIYEGLPRKECDLNGSRGAIFGEASSDRNEKTILYGNLKDPQLEGIIKRRKGESGSGPNATGAGDLSEEMAKKRKLKKESPAGKLNLNRGGSSGKLDGNSPDVSRIPLPLLSSDHKQQIKQIYEEINSMPALRRKRRLFNEDIGRSDNLLPLEGGSIDKQRLLREGIPLNSVMYTLGNLASQSNCLSFNEDCTKLACGLSNGTVHVRCLNDGGNQGNNGLSVLKSSDDLNQLMIYNTSGLASGSSYTTGGGAAATNLTDITPSSNSASAVAPQAKNMFHSTGTVSKNLLGHSEAVFGARWSTDGSLLVTASMDGTARLWSAWTWSCLCKYGGGSPAWCTDIAPIYGHYMATGHHDRSVAVYSTDSQRPLRSLLGDCRGPVTSLRFHPNCNYLATASSDRAVRIFDLRSGTQVRTFSGHKGMVTCVEWSECGRYLVSGGDRGAVCIWDLAARGPVSTSTPSCPHLLDTLHLTDGQDLTGGPVTSLALCRDGAVLSVGRQAGQIDIWNFSKIIKLNLQHADKQQMEESGVGERARMHSLDGIIDILYTKKTPVMDLRFNRRNMLCVGGVFNQL